MRHCLPAAGRAPLRDVDEADLPRCPGQLEHTADRLGTLNDREREPLGTGTLLPLDDEVHSGGIYERGFAQIEHQAGEAGFSNLLEPRLHLSRGRHVDLSDGADPDRVTVGFDATVEGGRRPGVRRHDARTPFYEVRPCLSPCRRPAGRPTAGKGTPAAFGAQRHPWCPCATLPATTRLV